MSENFAQENLEPTTIKNPKALGTKQLFEDSQAVAPEAKNKEQTKQLEESGELPTITISADKENYDTWVNQQVEHFAGILQTPVGNGTMTIFQAADQEGAITDNKVDDGDLRALKNNAAKYGLTELDISNIDLLINEYPFNPGVQKLRGNKRFFTPDRINSAIQNLTL